jgi:hypothetical protein
VEHEFVDDELERLRIAFVKAAIEFLSFIGRYTHPLGSSDWSAVLGHNEQENPDSPLRHERDAALKI